MNSHCVRQIQSLHDTTRTTHYIFPTLPQPNVFIKRCVKTIKEALAKSNINKHRTKELPALKPRQYIFFLSPEGHNDNYISSIIISTACTCTGTYLNINTDTTVSSTIYMLSVTPNTAHYRTITTTTAALQCRTYLERVIYSKTIPHSGTQNRCSQFKETIPRPSSAFSKTATNTCLIIMRSSTLKLHISKPSSPQKHITFKMDQYLANITSITS